MRKRYYVCKVIGGCLGASGTLSRLEGSHTSKAKATAVMAGLQKGERNRGTWYFVEWEWIA